MGQRYGHEKERGKKKRSDRASHHTTAPAHRQIAQNTALRQRQSHLACATQQLRQTLRSGHLARRVLKILKQTGNTGYLRQRSGRRRSGRCAHGRGCQDICAEGGVRGERGTDQPNGIFSGIAPSWTSQSRHPQMRTPNENNTAQSRRPAASGCSRRKLSAAARGHIDPVRPP
mgnify:CR=1 FL=1